MSAPAEARLERECAPNLPQPSPPRTLLCTWAPTHRSSRVAGSRRRAPGGSEERRRPQAGSLRLLMSCVSTCSGRDTSGDAGLQYSLRSRGTRVMQTPGLPARVYHLLPFMLPLHRLVLVLVMTPRPRLCLLCRSHAGSPAVFAKQEIPRNEGRRQGVNPRGALTPFPLSLRYRPTVRANAPWPRPASRNLP